MNYPRKHQASPKIDSAESNRRSRSARFRSTVAPFLSLTLALLLACAPAASAQGDPSANRALSSAALRACGADPLGAACVASALSDIDAARASEGLGPMTLPDDFGSLTVPVQLLSISNLERVDRGLSAVIGLSAGLDANAAAAAAADGDPSPSPSYGDAWSANWEGGYASSLEADFVWMYDDGPGSGNLDCTAPGAPGCWGHRHDILNPFNAPEVMGAAIDQSTAEGPSLTELFVGGDSETGVGEPDAPLTPTWSSIAQSLPIGLSATSLRLSGNATSAQLEIWASGQNMDVGAAITSGGAGWQVSPSSCRLTAGSSCELTITVTKAGMNTNGTLTLVGPNGPQAVPLKDSARITPKVRAALKRAVIALGGSTQLAGTVTPVAPGLRVALELRHRTVWRVLATTTIHRSGRFAFRVRAVARGKLHYRVVTRAEADHPAAVSATLTLRVT